MDRMEQLWLKHLHLIKSAPFARKDGIRPRYSTYKNGSVRKSGFPVGDAAALLAMMAEYRPRRIIEIGSGWSSALMLDVSDFLPLPDLQLTCIDPDTTRLCNRLRRGDYRRLTIIEDYVQNVPIAVFGQLRRNDILFIDSSHVLKAGSDVCYELFFILPSLAEGVVVHFHDIGRGFEYPRDMVFDKLTAWNEGYALHAFLLFNPCFDILFSTPMFYKERNAAFMMGFVDQNAAAGSSFWIQRCASA